MWKRKWFSLISAPAPFNSVGPWRRPMPSNLASISAGTMHTRSSVSIHSRVRHPENLVGMKSTSETRGPHREWGVGPRRESTENRGDREAQVNEEKPGDADDATAGKCDGNVVTPKFTALCRWHIRTYFLFQIPHTVDFFQGGPHGVSRIHRVQPTMLTPVNERRRSCKWQSLIFCATR